MIGTVNVLADEQLGAFERILAKRTGLDFDPKNRFSLQEAVRGFLAAGTITTAEELLAKLLDETDQTTLEGLVSRITIGETYFYRNRAHFDVLEKRILPALIERKTLGKFLRVWSAGCSTGEEVYSIAIALSRVIPDIDHWRITILGTDINAETLKRAREGVYTDWSFRGTEQAFRAAYFEQTDNGWRVRSRIRDMVTFAVGNLATDAYPSHATNTTAMDLIFCRNVMLYFNKKTALDITGRFYDALVDGGWLFVGHAESSEFVDPRFARRTFPDTVAFEKQLTATSRTFETKDRRPSRAPSARLSVLASRLAGPEGKADGERATAPPAKKSSAPPPADARPTHALLADARRAFEQGDFETTLDDARSAADKDPLLPQAYYLQALAQDALGCTAEATRLLRKCLFLDRSSTSAHWTLGDILLRLGRCDEAGLSLVNAIRSLEGKPDDQEIMIDRAVSVAALRRTARSALDRCGDDAPASRTREHDVE